MAKSTKKRLRQASECDGKVELLCFQCRHATADKTVQPSLANFLLPKKTAEGPSTATATNDASSTAPLCCSRCRRVMEKKTSAPPGCASKRSVLPHIARIRSYQRVAEQQGVPFTIAEHVAAARMREPCTMCGCAAPADGHGLTRLRLWPEHVARPARGKLFMGPFVDANLAPACGTCNLMKGARRVRSYVLFCRHVATHRAGEGDFGRYGQP